MAAPTQLGGNIGTGVLLMRPRHRRRGGGDPSSYQTDLARADAADVAVFAILAGPSGPPRPGGYFAAKRRLFAEGGDRCVIGIDEIEGQYLANQMGQGRRTTG